MIKGCPLDNKERLRVILHSECHLGQFDNEVCKKCPYFQTFLRGYPSLIANEIFGVQPMNPPTGMIFNLKFRYDLGEKNEDEKEK
jgi:hypothetical protein